MLDVSIEQIIQAAQPKKAKIYKILLGLALIAPLVVIMYAPAVMVLAEAILVVMNVLLYQYYDAEYEYTLVEKTLDIDRVMAKKRRKHMETFDLSKLEIMAPEGHEKLETYERMNCKVLDYSSGMKKDAEYIAFINTGAGMLKVILEPDEKFLDAFTKINSRKIFLK